MIIRILKNILFNFDFLSKNDWFYKADFNSLNHTWKSIPKKEKIISGQEEKIILKSRKILKKGWYLFGILHSGENIFCFGTLRSSKKGAAQSRPMFPSRRRWRVIRIKKDEEVFLELDNISEDLLIGMVIPNK